MHIIACCNPNPLCQYSYCEKVADRIVCWDSNQYENDKYGWFCEEHAVKVESK